MLIREAEHRAICDTLHDIYVAKNSDYGNSFVEVRNEFPESVLIRLSDKLNRLKALMKDPEKRKVNDESIDDTLMDLANYAIMELVERKFDEHSKKDKSDEDIKYEEPPLGNPPDFVPLDLRRLSEMIGQPVYIKDRGCKGHWEILTAVRKNLDGEDFAVRGNEQWQRIGNWIYRTKEGAYEDS